MALVSLLNDLLLDEIRRPLVANLYSQNYGLGLYDQDASPRVLGNPLRSGSLRPWRNLAAGDSGTSSIQSDKNEFRVNLDVQQFMPDELKVRVTDGFIVVEGKHEERSDQHGYISRQFTRRYKIPEDVDENALASNLSSDGILTLKAPKKAIPNASSREIPITRTNKPAVKAMEPEKAEESKQQ